MADEKKRDMLRMTVIESASPFTKRPSTPFRVAVLGIPQDLFCYEREATENNTEGFTKPAPLPVVPKPPVPVCSIESPDAMVIELGEWVTIPMDHGKNSFEKWSTDAEDDKHLKYKPKTKDLIFKITELGDYVYTFIATYASGHTCEVTIQVTVESPRLKCGENSSKLRGSGSSVFELPIDGPGTYYLYANLLSRPDDLFVWAGVPMAEGSKLLAQWKQKRNKHFFVFDYDGTPEGVYLQVNLEGTKGTGYNFMMFCPGDIPQEVIDGAEQTEGGDPPTPPGDGAPWGQMPDDNCEYGFRSTDSDQVELDQPFVSTWTTGFSSKDKYIIDVNNKNKTFSRTAVDDIGTCYICQKDLRMTVELATISEDKTVEVSLEPTKYTAMHGTPGQQYPVGNSIQLTFLIDVKKGGEITNVEVANSEYYETQNNVQEPFSDYSYEIKGNKLYVRVSLTSVNIV